MVKKTVHFKSELREPDQDVPENCIEPEIGSLAASYEVGELADPEIGDPVKARKFEVHLQHCAGCRRDMELFLLGGDLLKQYYGKYPEEFSETAMNIRASRKH